MEIIQEDDGKKGAFKALSNETVAGEMTYVWAGDTKFIIDHTEVDPAFAGKGIGRQLLMRAVAFARDRQLKIMPLCPFARSVFEKTKEIRDVLF
ncbi:GNAT family N-acetyltransferase [Niabella beijingensis]|uniref:GNAT family N-acetyltransferase n=1 Tax=Niabella beijingensis TaxID=2872700 RepID=UPI001CBFBDD1|nr:GNAT family N-acetyltransferase [Niabella beijingensis]MBZ4192364.1 N-acetyltransferase [Niabella beijingensis]